MLVLALACSRKTPHAPDHPESKPAAASAAGPAPSAAPTPTEELVAPTHLLSLPVSAYAIVLELDGDQAFLLTRTAAYCLEAGQPAHKLDLDLGIGPVLAPSGIVFWSKGAIWSASKQSKTVWHLAAAAKQPEYFVASETDFAWLDRVDNGPYRIQTLQGHKPRVIVSSQEELSALHMIHDWIFFVQRMPGRSWRIGRVGLSGGEVQYTDPRSSATPAMLSGKESLAYYDMDRSAIFRVTPDLKSENAWLNDFVCSPIYEAKNIYCSRVEGLFEILAQTSQPRVLTFGRRETITAIRANSKQIVWTVDAGPDQLVVEMLPVQASASGSLPIE